MSFDSSSMPEGASRLLDHGFIKLISHMGDDSSICNAARVSLAAGESFNDNKARTKKDDRRLINYLLSHGHTSPFEMVEFVFVVQAPIFVVRQWHRHRTWSYNEISGRYTELPAKQMYEPDNGQIHHKSKTIKQGRGAPLGAEDKEEYIHYLRRSYDCADQIYNIFTEDYDKSCSYPSGATGLDVAREIARLHLPVSTYTRMYAKVDLNNLLKFVNLRMRPNAQYEIRVYAQKILELIRPIVPMSVAAWEKHVFYANKFNRTESKNLKDILDLTLCLIEGECSFDDNSGSDFDAIGKLRSKHKKRIKRYINKLDRDL